MSDALGIPGLLVLSTVCLAVLAVCLMVFGRYRFVDCIPLLVIASVVFFLSRLDVQYGWYVGLRRFSGLLFLMLLWLPILLILRLSLRVPPLPFTAPVYILLAIFAGGAFLSGLINSPNMSGIIAPLHVLCITILPIALGFSVVAVVARNRKGHENLVTSFILFCGILIPLMMLVAAISPDFIGRYLGWGAVAERHGAGFSTARTPVGSSIASAMVANIAYGFALCRFLTRRQWISIIPVILCSLALLFSLQRSALAMFIIFNALLFIHVVRKHIVPIMIIGVLSLATVVAVNNYLPSHYNFDRFLNLSGGSVDLRLSGIKAAWAASVRAPVLGHGPGLLYHEFRTTFALERERRNPVHKPITIQGYRSPQEPHNTYAFIAAEFGAIGFFSFIGFMVYLWRKTQSKGLGDLSKQDLLYKKMYNAQWLAYFASMYTHSTPLGNPKAALLFWIFAAMGIHWISCRINERHLAIR